MAKIKLKLRSYPYYMPCSIIGVLVEGKPNFMTCSWFSRVNIDPPVWMVSINGKHHTLKGIKSNKEFSINFPSIDLVLETDYCGITSGKNEDKSTLFNLYYGETNAPMIEECTLNIELAVKNIIEITDHNIVLGNAINTYINEDHMSDGKPDMRKIKHFIYAGSENLYWSIGKKLGNAFEIGNEYKR